MSRPFNLVTSYVWSVALRGHQWSRWPRGISFKHSATYAMHPDNRPRLVLQASFDGASLHLLTLCGELLARIQASPADPLATIRIPPAAALTGAPGRAHFAVDVILPDGELLCAAPAGATVADAFGFPVLSGISFVE